MKKKLISLSLIIAMMVCFLAGCKGSRGEETIRVVDSFGAQGKIVLRAAKMLVEKQSDLKMEIGEAMIAPNSFKELTSDRADLFLSYDGTALTTLLKSDPSEVPADETIYDFSNKLLKEKYQCELLDKLGLNNTYVLAVKDDIYKKYDLKTTSDLVPVSNEIIFGAEHGFFDDEGSAKYTPYVKAYGLDFKDSISMDLNLKYTALDSNQIQASVVYATDGLILKSNLHLLEDDLNFFPEYNGALLVREDLFTKTESICPELKDILNQMGGLFTDETMRELSYQVDVDGKTPEEVAEAFLKEKGLIK